MNRETLRSLLDQYLTGHISDVDKNELARLIDLPEYREELESIMKADFINDTFLGEEDPIMKAGIQKYLSERMDNHKNKRAIIFTMTRRIAAACIILFLAGGTWFLLNHWQKSPATQAIAVKSHPVTSDINPGKNGAILTLSDGSKIVLDSTEGALAWQGNSQVINKEGQLSYAGRSAGTGVVYNTMTTPNGRQYQLVLSDGTKIWLNAGSSITYPTSFSGDERKVELTGEGYFEVAHKALKPFRVSVNNAVVEVLGTHFNINAYDDEREMRTTLLEGSVRVRKGMSTTLIVPGQQAMVDNSSDAITVKETIDLDQVIAWKNGLFQFDQADIKTIMKQVARWYDLDVEFDGEISKRKFLVIINRNSQLSEVLEALRSNDIVYKIEGKKLIVQKG
ncbi:MAG TPA: FecR domain-containing protein [Hanamia sp.]|nr:FecR domain-containing protein [Hanamia sp.]